MSSNVSSDDEEPEEEPDILGKYIVNVLVFDQGCPDRRSVMTDQPDHKIGPGVLIWTGADFRFGPGILVHDNHLKGASQKR